MTSPKPFYQDYQDELDKKYNTNKEEKPIVDNIPGSLGVNIAQKRRIEEPKEGTVFWYLDIFSHLHKDYYNPFDEFHMRLYRYDNIFLSAEEAHSKVMTIQDRFHP